MIEHSIITYVPPPPTPYRHSGPPPYTMAYRGKLGYADYIKRLFYKKGEYCAKTSVGYPVPDDAFWRIKDIQEVHHHVEWDEYTGLPFCLNLINKKGEEIWVTPNQIFRLMNPPASAQFELQE